MNPKVSIRELTPEEFLPSFEELRPRVFEGGHYFLPEDVFSEAERTRIGELKARLGTPYKLHLGAFLGDKMVGWSWGLQESGVRFHMVNSGVLKEHRRQGIYRALVDKTIKRVSKEGFQLIYSKHVITNNAVIIPKLQAGFTIGKMEIDDMFGVLVNLHYLTSEKRRKALEYRAGLLQPDEEIRELFRF